MGGRAKYVCKDKVDVTFYDPLSPKWSHLYEKYESRNPEYRARFPAVNCMVREDINNADHEVDGKDSLGDEVDDVDGAKASGKASKGTNVVKVEQDTGSNEKELESGQPVETQKTAAKNVSA